MADEQKPRYMDPNVPVDDRVEDLVSRMTLEEKASQMLYNAPAIPRLGIPDYNWWNECLHGVARAGIATVFPQAIGMAASWNDELLHEVACVISDEGRAKHHEFERRGDHGIYKGLTFWSPNVNIFRDPRWGRGHETYGEDPYLTSCMGVAFCRGIQGADEAYLKAVATPKHYAVHSGPEPERHRFDARASIKDMRETYLPAFKACVQEAGALSVMGAYNRTNGEPCCGSKTLLQDLLRDEWGFEGYVVSDCGAVGDFHTHHKITANAAESVAMAVKAGCDLNCGQTYTFLMLAVEEGLLEEAAVDRSVKRLMRARMLLGMFDPPERVRYAQIPYEVNDSEEHRELARRTARESIVLLKNEGDVLPLRRDLKSIAVIGPNADSLDVLLGNYFGTPSRYVTLLDGIRGAVSEETEVWYAVGSDLFDGQSGPWEGGSEGYLAEALAAADRAEVVVLCLGLSPRMEGEEGDVANSDGGGDRIRIDLPDCQQRLLKAVCETGKPVVLALTGGSALAINWAAENVPAILDCWYPGEEGGTAVADVLFGDYSPAGRLPVTFVRSLEQLPPFVGYSMDRRTYRFMKEAPLYPFGFGLSYTRFEYSNLQLNRDEITPQDELEVSVDVRNSGDVAGDEVVQLYLTDMEATTRVPVRDLRGFSRLHLAPGDSATVRFTLTPRQMALIDDEGRCVLEPGQFAVSVGGRQPDKRSEELGGSNVLSAMFTVEGEATELPY